MTTWATISSVRVADMAGALRFYRDVLGFEVLRGGPDDSNRLLQHGTRRLAHRPWGQRELTVEDTEGNWLTFWQAADRS